MTKTYRAYGFDHPLKTELEHLLSIEADLKRATRALHLLVSPASLLSDTGIIGPALYTQALVSYVRCFASGRRKGLSDAIFSEKPGYLVAHNDIKSIRDKHVAHSVTNDEHCGVMVAAEHTTARAVGLGVRYWFFLGGDEKHMKVFLRVVTFVTNHVKREIDKKGDELAKLVIGPQATWKRAQTAFHKRVTPEQVYGPIRRRT